LAAALALLAASEAGAQPAAIPLKAVPAIAARLTLGLGMPPPKRAVVEAKVAALIADARFIAKYGATPIRGVFAYQMGEGGFLVKVKRGHGLVHLSGEASDRQLILKSVTVGAQIGGSSEWGVGLVLGLSDPRSFGGDYSGGTVAATFADESTTMMELTSKTAADHHTVYLIGTASGASANAGGGKLNIKVVR
jgi:hypothetical protein